MPSSIAVMACTKASRKLAFGRHRVKKNKTIGIDALRRCNTPNTIAAMACTKASRKLAFGRHRVKENKQLDISANALV